MSTVHKVTVRDCTFSRDVTVKVIENPMIPVEFDPQYDYPNGFISPEGIFYKFDLFLHEQIAEALFKVRNKDVLLSKGWIGLGGNNYNEHHRLELGTGGGEMRIRRFPEIEYYLEDKEFHDRSAPKLSLTMTQAQLNTLSVVCPSELYPTFYGNTTFLVRD
jgi:hypothetical protein